MLSRTRGLVKWTFSRPKWLEVAAAPPPALAIARPCNSSAQQLSLRRLAARHGRAGFAALAQLVEHVIRNDGVRCSNHLSGTIFLFPSIRQCSLFQRKPI